MNWDGVVITGLGETDYHKNSTKGPLYYIYDSVRKALEDSNILPNEVDGLAVTSFQLPPDNVTTVAEHMGFEINWTFHGTGGGASPVSGVLNAVRAIQAGDAEVVV